MHNDSTEMSSFSCKKRRKEAEAVRNQLSENKPMQWPLQMSIRYREAYPTIDELREMAASNIANTFMSKVSTYVG